MLGKIFLHLKDFGNNCIGQSTWNQLLNKAVTDLDETVSPKDQIPDEKIRLLVEALASKQNWSAADTWRKFGKYSTEQFLKSHQDLVDKYKTPRELFNSINDMHYVGVKNVYPNANPPYFYNQPMVGEVFLTRYLSNRKMCFYFEGGVQSLAEYFGTTIGCKQKTCQHQGAAHCEFEITFASGT